MKFKIGDEVFIKKLTCDSSEVKVGDKGMVKNIYLNDEYPIRLEINKQNDYGFKEDELCLTTQDGCYINGFIEIKRERFIYENLEGKFKQFLKENGFEFDGIIEDYS